MQEMVYDKLTTAPSRNSMDAKELRKYHKALGDVWDELWQFKSRRRLRMIKLEARRRPAAVGRPHCAKNY
jgi:hypothetical protein